MERSEILLFIVLSFLLGIGFGYYFTPILFL